MESNERYTQISVSQDVSHRITPSLPAILTTTPGGVENDVVVDETGTGNLRSRGRRRRPGRGRVRLQDDQNNSDDPQTRQGEESSELLHPRSLTFLETPTPPSSRLGSARGSFKNLVSRVSDKVTASRKQGKKYFGDVLSCAYQCQINPDRFLFNHIKYSILKELDISVT